MKTVKAGFATAIAAAALLSAIAVPGADAEVLYQKTDLLVPTNAYFPSGMDIDHSTGDLYVAGVHQGLHRFSPDRVETTYGPAIDFKSVAAAPEHKSFGLTAKTTRMIALDASGNQTASFGVGGSPGDIGTDAAGNVFVPAPAAITNEQQTLTISATGGTYTLSFEGQSTGTMSFDASAEEIQTALEGLSPIGAGNVEVSGRTITFQGVLAGIDVPELTADTLLLTGGSLKVETTVIGSTYPLAGVREFSPTGTLKQVIDCSACPAPAEFSKPAAVDFDADGNMYVADSGGARVIKFVASAGDPTDYTSVPPEVFSTGASVAVAVDRSNGDVFIGGDDGSGYHVTGYHSDGVKFTDFGLGELDNLGELAGEFFGMLPDQLAVDPQTGHVHVDDINFSGESRIWEYAPVLAPTESPLPASGITQDTATLNATVNPMGDTVIACHFEYGLDTSYGQSTECADYPGFGTDPVGVSADIGGLAPNTTYHYRVVATNAAGTSESTDEEFTTLVEKPIVSTGSASAISATAATISGSVDPKGSATSTCHFEYGTTTAYGSQAPCPTDPGEGQGAVGESLPVSGLAPNTTYHYRLVAENPGGTSRGADGSFKTLPRAPGTSTGSASDLTPTTAKVAGSIDPQGVQASYRFEYGTTPSYGQSSPAGGAGGQGAQAVAVSLASLKPSTTYHYRLISSNAGGATQGADRTFTTQARPKGRLILPATAVLRGKKAAVPLECRGAKIAICEGTLTLRARVKQGIRLTLVQIGQAAFQVDGDETKAVSVTLNGNGRKALAGTDGKALRAIASADGHNREVRISPRAKRSKHAKKR